MSDGSIKSIEDVASGDIIYVHNKGKLVKASIIELYDTGEFVDMYNIEYVKRVHTFFANGILVHNKRGGSIPSIK